MADTWCKRAENELVLRAFDNKVDAALCCKSLNPVSLFDKEALQKVRNDLKNGIKNKHCGVCWFHESKGMQSWRQMGNAGYINDDIEKTIEVYLDNTCDLSCIYCSHKYSSKWAQEITHASKEDQQFLQTVLNDDTFVATEKVNHTKIILDTISDIGKKSKPNKHYNIILLGGEPLLSPFQKKDIIDDIVNAFYKETYTDRFLTIGIVTNGNTPDTIIDKTIKTILDKQKKYPNITFKINLSMESVGDIAEFVRYGVNWNQFLKNYKKYLEAEIIVGFSMTVNIVSFDNMPKFFEQIFRLTTEYSPWRKRTYFRLNLVEYPRFLSIALFDERYKHIFEETKQIIKNNKDVFLDNNFYDQLLKEIEFAETLYGSNTDIKLYNTALKYFEYLKRTRNTDLEKINNNLYKFLLEMKNGNS
jgi:organic radical activating enzyme